MQRVLRGTDEGSVLCCFLPGSLPARQWDRAQFPTPKLLRGSVRQQNGCWKWNAEVMFLPLGVKMAWSTSEWMSPGNKLGTCSSIPWLKMPSIYWGLCSVKKCRVPLCCSIFLLQSHFKDFYTKRQKVTDVPPFLTWDSFRPRLMASFFLSVLLIYFCFWNIFSKAFLWSSEKTALLNMPLRALELDSWVRRGRTLSSPSGNGWELHISNTYQKNIKCCSL